MSAQTGEIPDLNYPERIQKKTACLNVWNFKGLSTLGRVLIVKLMAISRLIYQLSMLPTPTSSCMDKIKDLLYKFIWNNKTNKIIRKVMNQDNKLGECRRIDITVQNKTLKLTWIPHILENIDSFWIQSLQANLHFPIEHILLSNLNKKDMVKCMDNCINMFWYEMLLYWSELIYKDKISTFQGVVDQPLWLNSHVKYNKVVSYAPSLVHQGIMLIAYILTTDHTLPTLTQQNAKFNLAWQEYTYDKLISAIPIK